jgi:hypothetical protein
LASATVVCRSNRRGANERELLRIAPEREGLQQRSPGSAERFSAIRDVLLRDAGTFRSSAAARQIAIEYRAQTTGAVTTRPRRGHAIKEYMHSK